MPDWFRRCVDDGKIRTTFKTLSEKDGIAIVPYISEYNEKNVIKFIKEHLSVEYGEAIVYVEINGHVEY
jgi:hypothetical protein